MGGRVPPLNLISAAIVGGCCHTGGRRRRTIAGVCASSFVVYLPTAPPVVCTQSLVSLAPNYIDTCLVTCAYANERPPQMPCYDEKGLGLDFDPGLMLHFRPTSDAFESPAVGKDCESPSARLIVGCYAYSTRPTIRSPTAGVSYSTLR